MQNLILCNSFYNDITELSNLISNLEYTDCLYGRTIKDFQYVPQPLEQMFSQLLNVSIEIQPDTGTFIKPNSLIHFDNFYQHTLWTCIVALEETELKLYEHELGYRSFFDISTDIEQFFLDNCNKPENWKAKSTINIEKNGFMFIRPWLWKSLMEDKLIQVFTLNSRIEESKE